MSSLPTEDSNIFSFSVSQWCPGTMTMGPPWLKWLLMRSSPESNRGFSQWIMKWWVPRFKSMIHSILHLFGRLSFLIVMDPICCASHWGLPQRSAHLGPVLHHDVVTNRQKALWSHLAQENTRNIWWVIWSLNPSSKLPSSSSSVFRSVYVIFVCYTFLVSWFVGRGRWHSRSMRCIQDEECVFKCPRVGLSGDKCLVCLL